MFFAIFTYCSISQIKMQKSFEEDRGGPPRLPKSSPRSAQDVQNGPRHLQDTPQTPLGAPKTHSGCTQDASRVSQAAPDPQTSLPGPIQSIIFERLGRQKLRCYLDFSKLTSQLTTQASKHPKWDGGMRGAFESTASTGCRRCVRPCPESWFEPS